MAAIVKRETVTIPTYGVGEPEACPVFLERRVYQGSSGAVYPHPVIEKILDHKEDRQYQALLLENDYLKVMILPELGGRVQMAYDKLGERHFIYYNQVIKPALVGLLGPWISGGIEFNWPQHHRPSTFHVIDSDVQQNADGSVSALVHEIERMTGTEAVTRFTLYTGKAYLKISAQIYNRTPLPKTFLWWANPAVKVNDHYESVFPPDVNAVFDHGKRDVSTFPIATGTYYKVDYSAGVDIARYKNVPVPTSYMAASSRYDFLGCYEHDTGGGMLHVANHHIAPGKKQWTWGNGDFGRAWDSNLTDEDGPYVELMCGAFTDNQPDFSWLAPYEEKRFDQYFFPYREIGRVHNASKDAALHFDVGDDTPLRRATLKLFVTSIFEACQLSVRGPDQSTVFEERLDLTPERSITRTFDLSAPHPAAAYLVSLKDSRGRVLISYRPEPKKDVPPPPPAEAAPTPVESPSVEQLYLTGLHLEQYRHATRSPADFYREALRREPADARCNNALGRWLLRCGQLADAKSHFEAAIATLTQRNPNPYDGEPSFNLGVALQLLGELEPAYDAFFKASWNAAQFSAAHLHLAQIASTQEDYERALDHVEQALLERGRNHQAMGLMACLLRLCGRTVEAVSACQEALKHDPFNFMALYESTLHDEAETERFRSLTRGDEQNLIECSLDYARAGLFVEASSILKPKDGSLSAITGYLRAWVHHRAGDLRASTEALDETSEQRTDFCFPNRVEEMLALQLAVALRPEDAKAHYCLGNFLYAARRPEEAIAHWQRAIEFAPQHAIAHRNLAIACYNHRQDGEQARQMLSKALELAPTPRLLMESDQLNQRRNVPARERLALLKRHRALSEERDDVMASFTGLLNRASEHEEALTLLRERKFHPWEGGEGVVTGEWVHANLAIALCHFFNEQFAEADRFLDAARTYPENLGEGKLPTIVDSELLYWKGRVQEALLQPALSWFEQGASGAQTLTAAAYYNDQPPDAAFYQAVCLHRLGNVDEARNRFSAMLHYGQTHLHDPVEVDYFAVSLPDLSVFNQDLRRNHEIHCHYLLGLGQLGMGATALAQKSLGRVLSLECCHAGALRHMRLLSRNHGLSLDSPNQPVAAQQSAE